MSRSLPEGSQRLFAHYGEPESLAETAFGLVMARLMEEGDSNDLRWLTATYSETQITEWLVQHGRRQLSRRSYSFWQSLLRRPDPSASSTAAELWLL